MKKLYFVETNGYNMVVSVEEDQTCRYLTETEEFPYLVPLDEEEKQAEAEKFLESIIDDSNWEDDCSYEQLFCEFPCEIIAKIEREW